MSKNLKIHTQIVIGFIIMELLLIVSLYTGYTSASQMLTVDDPERYLSNFATFTAIEFIIMVIISTGITIAIPKIIKNAINQLTVAANALAEGQVDIKLDTERKDEFGVLYKDFQVLIDNIKYEAEVTKEISTGNLDVEVVARTSDDVMRVALSELIDKNSHAISNVKDAAYQVNVSASQVASASEALAQGSTEQASAIEQITASIADVAEKTKENAAQANVAAELISKAIEDVKTGNVQMQDMVVAMQEINKASENISKIIKVIDDIAFQTNILALNAAVEAARAGEAGKGFAVVAEEVRNLAAKSSAAAAETAELIENSIQKVETGSKMANVTAEALVEINDVVKKSESIITDIASASNYQATAIVQIEQAIGQVSQVVQTNSATSEECAAASQEMSSQAVRVRDLVSAFKLSEKYQHGADAGNKSTYNSKKSDNTPVISLSGNFGKY